MALCGALGLALTGCGQASHHTTSTATPRAKPPNTNPAPEKIHIGGAPIGLLSYQRQLWVADAERNRVLRVTYEAADAVTTTGSTLRVTSDQGPSTAMLDPKTGRLTDNVKLSDAFIGDANADVVAAGNGLWVSSPDQGTLYKLSP